MIRASIPLLHDLRRFLMFPMRYPFRFRLTLLLILAFTAIGGVRAAFDPMAGLGTMDSGGDSISSQIRQLLHGRKRGEHLDTADWKALQAFYAERDFKPLWIEGDHPKPLVNTLIDRMTKDLGTGLTHRDLLTFTGFNVGASGSEQQAAYELHFTEVFLTYARVLSVGRYQPKKIDKGWSIKARRFDLASFLSRLGVSTDIPVLLDGLEPQRPGYKGLRQAYRHYAAIAGYGGWSTLPSSMPSLKPGMRHASVPRLRVRLRAEFGDRVGESDSTHYDADLVAAVKHFQRNNGLEEDGVVGPHTRSILNIPVEDRMRSILASMERWRWLPRDLGVRYLIVNLPAFELYLYEDGRVVWQTRVVVGDKKHHSPSISSNISVLTVNPKWHVPTKIAAKELIPKQLRNPDFFQRNGYQILWRDTREEIYPDEVDWDYYSNNPEEFPYLIRQGSGEKNALGQLKFEMPSKHAIYLHDTPSKRYFARTERAFSHGCIRVQNPYKLAGLLLDKNDPEAGRETIRMDIDAEETKSVKLPEKVPVYLGYFTAWVDAEGEVNFRDDIYERNKLFSYISQVTD